MRIKRGDVIRGICFSLFLVFLLTSTVSFSAEIYRWTDEKGTVHFTDDPTRIPERYSNQAVHSLVQHGNKVAAIGKRPGKIGNVEILTGQPKLEPVDTITLYLSQKNQEPLEDYILSLKPKRIIFNPGAENPRLKMVAEKNGIETLDACTLVMLTTGQY